MKIDKLIDYVWNDELSGDENDELRHQMYEQNEIKCAEALKQVLEKLEYEKVIENWKPDYKKRIELLIQSELLRRDVVAGRNDDLKELCEGIVLQGNDDVYEEILNTITSCGL